MKTFVFVLMPFNENFDDIYKLGIKVACQSENVYCERVDEQYYDGSMLDRIYNQIQHADYIIADMTGKNPNVFYEVGYAHALQKKVILITQDGDDIPFDMKHFHHIIYKKDRISLLKDEIEKRIKWYLSSNSDVLNESNFDLDVYLNGTKLVLNEQKTIRLVLSESYMEYGSRIDYDGRIGITLRNTRSIPFIGKNVNVSIVLSSTVPIATKHSAKILPNDRIMISTNFEGETIYPSDYWGKNISIEFNSLWKKSNQVIKKLHYGEIIVSRPYNILEYPFNLSFIADPEENTKPKHSNNS